MLDIFKAYKFNKKKAISFGFIEENGIFKYSSLILENDFQLIVSIEDKEISFKFMIGKRVIYILKSTWKVWEALLLEQ